MKKTAIYLSVITAALTLGAFTTNVNADTYNNFAELSDAEVEGIDYTITSADTASEVAIIAIHGGSIEKGSDQIAYKIAELGQYDFYAFKGIKRSGNSKLHITSSKFDEPLARSLVAKSKETVSIHGCSGDEKIIYIGGLDNVLRKKIKAKLEEAGFTVEESSTFSGTEKSNIANSNLSKMGVQLELSKGLRDIFFNGSEAADPFNKFTNAIKDAISETK